METQSNLSNERLRLESENNCYGGSMSWFSDFIVYKDIIYLIIIGVVIMLGASSLINYFISKDCNERTNGEGENE